jgi:GTP pyrophosphokinase
MIPAIRAFSEPLLATRVLDTGENMLAHADAVAAILKSIGGSEAMQAGSYLVYACEHLNKPHEVIEKAFGSNFADLALQTSKLVALQRTARSAHTSAAQTESVRKMLLAFSRDLRVVMLRLASRLQTLRYYAASKQQAPSSIASEALQIFAPLANRLGIGEIKWEMEDLSFRFLEPDTYRQIARLLEEKRAQRETDVEKIRQKIAHALKHNGVKATVQGRPKHIYSIVKKMRGKSLSFDRVYDISALRIIVPTIPDCYGTLSWVHEHFAPIPEEFDDYIARPKANGYQSLHTVVRDDRSKPIEIQIRTQSMHDHAENGVAAHWAYKEAGTKGYAGVSAKSEYDTKIAVLRQLLAWERDLSGSELDKLGKGFLDDTIYVLTPKATIIELTQGSTAVDFAYSVHTSLGHRCRGAKIDGMMVPLNKPLRNGQMIEIITVKEGGPSRDWLNPELGFLASHRGRTKVRAWFNAQAMNTTIAKGRDVVEKLLQREGKTAIKLDDLAAQLGFNSADALFEVVGKDELSRRAIEAVIHPPEPVNASDERSSLIKKPSASEARSKDGVLVVGMNSLMTQLGKCCKPAPPDAICGFVTKGKGVSIHRADCANLRNMVTRSSERLIEVQWGGKTDTGNNSTGSGGGGGVAMYPVDVAVQAIDRQGLLRDISEVFTKEKMNVIGVHTESVRGMASMLFTVEVSNSGRLNKVLQTVGHLNGVQSARRR